MSQTLHLIRFLEEQMHFTRELLQHALGERASVGAALNCPGAGRLNPRRKRRVADLGIALACAQGTEGLTYAEARWRPGVVPVLDKEAAE